jgi:competence protein ComEA
MARSTDHQDVVSRRLALLDPERAAEPPAELPAAPPVPVPGRHAARRSAALLPETLRGRVALGPAQLTVVAVLLAAGLVVTCWWVLHGQAARVEAPPPVSVASEPALVDVSPVAASASAGAPTGSVTVDVTGKVRHPGIVVLDAGARVVDALEAAGGARPGVDLSGLNLARLLVDGEQVVVGVPAPPGVAAGSAAGATASPGAPGAPLVNLNTASQSELEALPEVGPVTAQAILAWRDEHGGFTAVDELLEVDGIGDATLGQVAPYVTV